MHRRQQFSVIDLAHRYWEQILEPGDSAIDATCGNGHDTLKLAQILTKGKVFSLDIQKKAIESAQKLLSSEELTRVSFYEQSHADFSINSGIKLIVYNLGYLPGHDKSITTQTSSTLISVKKALELATHAVSIACYPGHEEGAKEEKALLELCSTLDPKAFAVSYTQWVNRKLAPSLLFINKLF